MTGSRFSRMSAALAVGALIGAMPLVMTSVVSEEQGAPPGVNVCVFYGICVGPALPGR